MVIKRFTSMLGTKRNTTATSTSTSNTTGGSLLDRLRGDSSGGNDNTVADVDTPEANAGRAVRLFCESGGPDNAGEEVLHLPVIVEAAESSPAAATVAAKQIRRFLSKDHYAKPHVQYNAIMLVRILADNPGPSFTRNVDSKFVSTVKELLRNGRDPSVQQILRETLQALFVEKAYDTNLQHLSQMWSKEQRVPMVSPSAPRTAQPPAQPQYGGRQPQHRGNTALPPPAELAARVEEAKTSAKLLQQLVQSTAPRELQSNDLVKEFSDRCQAAQRSMQNYINSDNPPPDDDTMQTLIETSEQLSLAASKHSRALLQARRATAQSRTPPPQEGDMNGTGAQAQYASATFVPSARLPAPAPAPAHAQARFTAPYMPPPVPPTTMRANLDRRASQDYTSPTAATQPGRTGSPDAYSSSKGMSDPQSPKRVQSQRPNYDDPFSDNHEHGQEEEDEHDDLYGESPTAESRAPPFPQSSAGYPTSISGGYGSSYTPTTSQSPSRPAPQPQDSWRQPLRGPEGSYAPGFKTTPSYICRQESSGDNLTMHGATANISEEVEPVSPELERREQAGRGLRNVMEGNEHGEVSPLEVRYSAGYRYARE